MIISYIMGGIGNQLYQYAAGLKLARKHKTQLKLDTSYYAVHKFRSYALDQFNITADIASPEEIQRVQKISERDDGGFMPEFFDYPDGVWLFGYWQHEEYFADVADELRREFTLRQLGTSAQRWREKIFAAKCSVSVHVRHGDFVYNPINATFAVLPLNYYRDCIERLKREHPNITMFVFSDDLNWCRGNFRFGVPTEFVAGDGLTDAEELHLMSLCKHNVIANSTFSRWAAWLNHNPNKKIFAPKPSTAKEISTPIANSPFDSDRWIRVPFKIAPPPLIINLRPYFSLLTVVNDDAATLQETFDSLLTQDYKYYELIIVDNASTDGSREICQSAAAHENVTFIKLYDRISNGAAWNKALDVAQGKFVMFLRGDDRIFANALTYLYMANEHALADVVNSAAWFREDSRGTIAIADRKFFAESDALLRDMTEIFRGKLDKSTILKLLASTVVPVGTKVFKREFLADNALKFDEKLNGVDAELFFMLAAMFKADEMLFTPEKFFIAPCTNNARNRR